MNRALASIGIAATLVCGSAAPALAADNPIDAKITYISSGSSQVSSPVTVKGTWSTKKLEVGQSFNVTSDVINWAYDFPFTLNDDTRIGSCKTDKGTLTCTVDNVPDSVANKTDISGIWWTTARLQESVVGKKRGEISIGVEHGRSPLVTRIGTAPVTTTATAVTTRTLSLRIRSGAGSIPMAPLLG